MTVAVEDVVGGKIRVYPNPFGDWLWVEFANSDAYAFHATLYDSYGRPFHVEQLYESARIGLDVRHVPAGVYILSLSGNDAVVPIKVVKSGK
jgi:hypothetical protein